MICRGDFVGTKMELFGGYRGVEVRLKINKITKGSGGEAENQ